MASPSDLSIGTLRVQATAREAALIAADLRDGSWRVGDNQDWLFIRELTVRAPRASLRLDASSAVRQQAGRAVAGGSTAAASANAVRFSTLAELLTYLLRDLLQGRRQAWFWQHWQHLFTLPRSEAITELLWPNIELFSAVSERLARMGALPLLWSSLQTVHANMLLTRLASLQHLSVQRLRAAPLQPLGTADAEADSLLAAFQQASALTGLWRTALRTSPASAAQVRLAGVAVGLAVMPQALAQQPEAVMRAFAHLLGWQDGTGTVEDVLRPSRAAPHALSFVTDKHPPVLPAVFTEPESRRNHAYLERAVAKVPHDTTALRASMREWPVEGTASQAPTLSSAARTDAVAPAVLIPAIQADSMAPVRDAGAAALPQTPAQESDFLYQGQIAMGGVYYLINALSHPETYALVRGRADWQALLSGWSLIYRLALALGASLDLPLQRFFAAVCGVESITQSPGESHHELVQLLLPLFERRYAGALTWDASLLAVPAWVQMSRSHVDVSFDMSAISLPLRLSGLDLDPGWVPWLGRVIRFHYRDEPTLRRERSDA